MPIVLSLHLPRETPHTMSPPIEQVGTQRHRQTATPNVVAPAIDHRARNNIEPVLSALRVSVDSPPRYLGPANNRKIGDETKEEHDGLMVLQIIIFGILCFAIMGAIGTLAIVLKQ